MTTANNTGGIHTFITPAIIERVLPNVSKGFASRLAFAFNEACPEYGLDKPDLFHEFFAQCAVESQEFTRLSENMTYTTADRIIKIFGKARFPSEQFARKYVRNARGLANYVYANRMGNGGVETDDGWNYRGGGGIQMTGKDMWTRYAKFKGKKVENVLVQVRTDLRWAIDSACWVFAIEKKLLDEAEADLFNMVTKRINPAMVDNDRRRKYYETIKKYLPE